MSAGSVLQKIDELYKKASQEGEQGNLQLALQYYEQALQLARENNFTNLVQNLEEAVSYTKKLIEVNSLIDDAIQSVYRGNYKQAYEEVEKATTIAKELGVEDEKIEDIKKAIKALAEIPEFKFETKIVNLEGFSKFIKSLLDYYTIAKEKAQEAVAHFPEFAPVLQFFLEMKGKLTILNDAVSQLVNAENITSSISRDDSYDEQIKTINNAISQVQEAKAKANSLAPTNEFLQKLQQITVEFADGMMKELTGYKLMLEDLKKSKKEADAGKHSKAVLYLEKAQEISNAKGFGVNLQKLHQGFFYS